MARRGRTVESVVLSRSLNPPTPEEVTAFERAYLAALLEQAGGNMSKAARTAGIDRMYLHRLVQKHGLR